MTERQRIEAAQESWERFSQDPTFFMNFNDFYNIFCEGIRVYVEAKEQERIARKAKQLKKQYAFLKKHGLMGRRD